MHAFHEQRTYSTEFPFHASVADGFSFHAHWHREVELMYGLEGTSRVGINAEVYVVEPGDLLIVESGGIHYYNNEADECGSSKVLAIFSPDLLFAALRHGHFQAPLIKREDLEELGIANETGAILGRLHTQHSDDGRWHENLVRSDLCRLYALLRHNLPQSGHVSPRNAGMDTLERLQRLLDYIEENCDLPLSLDDAAKRMHFSPYHFSRMFKKLTGMGFSVYVNSVRIQRAQDMINDGGDTILSIAMRCGYGSIRTFNRAFRAVCGCTPTEYRIRGREI